jgi:hypothetical protein
MISTNPNKANHMKIKVTLLLVTIIGIGIYLLRDRTSQNELESNSDNQQAEAQVNSRTSNEPLPLINFSLLGEARPIDLIDMTLAFPESLKSLDGRRVSLIGFMAPFDNLDDMSRCMIVPSYVGCTFCSPPNLRQVVFVTQGSSDAPKKTYSFIEEPSYITGIFRISNPEDEHEGKKQGFVYSIENAEVKVHTGEAPKRAPSHATPGGHNKGQSALTLPPVSPTDLIAEVTKILGTEPLHPLTIEQVPAEIFGNYIRTKLEVSYPKKSRAMRAQAFSLLGMLKKPSDWIETLAGLELQQRVATSDDEGRRVLILDSVPMNHPFVRIELVNAIADAFIRQRLLKNEDEKDQISSKNEDIKLAKKSLRLGIAKIVARRYARSLSISPSFPPPDEFVPQEKDIENAYWLDRWYSLPAFVGPFFVDFLVGPTGPLKDMESAIVQPPSSMMEFLRPPWYQNESLWERNPVPHDFANELMKNSPDLVDVLGVGGLIPWLAKRNSSYSARALSGKWVGDRWALWKFSDDAYGILLETRWQDETSALEFSAAVPKHPYQWFFPHKEGSSTVRLIRGSSATALNLLDPITQ